MEIWKELRYSARRLKSAPGFTAVAVLTLALAIGANTAIFTVVDSLLLKPLAYPQADRLMVPMRAFQGGGRSQSVSMPRFIHWRDHNTVFSGTAAFIPLASGFNLAGDGRPERLKGLRVSRNFFDVLGVRPALGRGIAAEEDRPGAAGVAVLSDGLWRRRFGADPGLIGRSIRLNGEGYAVLGVMPASFRPPVASELWTALATDPTSHDKANYLLVVGRLKDGISQAAALAAMKVTNRQFAAAFPGAVGDHETVALDSLQQMFYGDLKTALFVLLGAVGAVLLIACVNLGNLELARAAARKREIAVRTALGAGGERIARQLLLESLLLAALGGGAGLLVASWLLPALLALSPADLPAAAKVSIDGGVLAFTAGISLLSGLLFGLAPALQALRSDLRNPLQEGSQRTTLSKKGAAARWLLVAAEVALALVLITGAVLLAKSFLGVVGTNPGFSPERVLTLKLSLPEGRYATPEAFERVSDQLAERVGALPGVEAAAIAGTLPMEDGADLPFAIEGKYTGRGQEGTGEAQFRPVSAGFFKALQIPLVAGRGFLRTDGGGAPAVALINQAAAHEFFPKENPVGQRITLGMPFVPELADSGPRTIVGVVRDVREQGLDRKPPAILYIPTGQMNPAITTLFVRLLPIALVVRTTGSAAGILPAIEREVWSVDREQPLSDVRPMKEVVGRSLGVRRFSATLLAGLAFLALVLAGVGVYGVLAYQVEQRTREIGVRMAFGAARSDVLSLVMRQGLLPVVGGLVAGLALALGATRLLASLLYGVSATDPATFVVTPAVLTAIALLSIAIPARRASRLEPQRAIWQG
jgi:putative ABC transport system permease protein